MQWRHDTTLPSRGLGLRPIGKSKLAAFDAALPGSRRRCATEQHLNARLNPCKQTLFSVLMALAASLPTIFQDRANVAAGGLASYRLCQRETSLEMRQVFMAGPDDGQVDAPTFLGGTRYA
jgi:hypothetical protein